MYKPGDLVRIKASTYTGTTGIVLEAHSYSSHTGWFEKWHRYIVYVPTDKSIVSFVGDQVEAAKETLEPTYKTTDLYRRYFG